MDKCPVCGNTQIWENRGYWVCNNDYCTWKAPANTQTWWQAEGLWHDPIRQQEDGWYFETADEALEGPYASYELAKIAMDEYCEWLDHDSPAEEKLEFLTGKDYPWLCPKCQAMIDTVVQDILPEAEDTDDTEYGCNFLYDHRMFCGGDHCTHHVETQP